MFALSVPCSYVLPRLEFPKTQQLPLQETTGMERMADSSYHLQSERTGGDTAGDTSANRACQSSAHTQNSAAQSCLSAV